MPTDHFGPVAGGYATFRPSYPQSLFDALASLAPSRARAWDCGCGSGQATIALAQHFTAVLGSDVSASQIAHAETHARVTYRVAPAHESELPDASVDLVTVAQALHWFDVSTFHAEVKRVLVPRGVIAEWTYGLLRVPSCPPITNAVLALDERLHAWWPPERRHVDNNYRDLAFPFASLDAGTHTMSADWTGAQLLGFLGTWSAVTRYRAAHCDDPVDDVRAVLAEHWNTGLIRRIEWPLLIRVGRV